MLRGNLATYQEFVSTRTSEIRSKSDTQKEWRWIPSSYNIADMGTRNTVVPADMSAGSVYQIGMPWMLEEADSWPTLQEPASVPDEEILRSAKVASVGFQSTWDAQHKKFSSFKKLTRVFSAVLTAKDRFKKLPAEVSHTDLTQLEKAQVFLLHDAQKQMFHDLEKGKYASLRPRLLKSDADVVPLIVVSGRLGEGAKVGFDKSDLPLLEPSHRLSLMIMNDAHDVSHAGVDRTVQVSRGTAWIIRAGTLAKFVVN